MLWSNFTVLLGGSQGNDSNLLTMHWTKSIIKLWPSSSGVWVSLEWKSHIGGCTSPITGIVPPPAGALAPRAHLRTLAHTCAQVHALRCVRNSGAWVSFSKTWTLDLEKYRLGIGILKKPDLACLHILLYDWNASRSFYSMTKGMGQMDKWD